MPCLPKLSTGLPLAGPVRLDVAYNPYPLPRGPLYLINPAGDIVGLIDPDFRPDRGRGFLKRLTLHISIGQTV